MLSIIVAKAKNNIIGKDNKMIWHLPEDLKHFKELTTGHAIIMGRKTFESLGKVLPDRKHIVFTQNPDFKVNDNNVEIVHSLLQIQDLIEGEEEAFIIGGAMIYNFLMPYVKKMYVTEIKEEFEGDAFFPKISENTWKETSREKGIKDEENPLDYEYLYYTITNIINLLYINRKVSPLTNLPGNVQIQAEMKKRLLKKQFFVMLYIDLDNFKAYNDVY